MHHQASSQKSGQKKDNHHRDLIHLKKVMAEATGNARLALVYIARETDEFREAISESKSELAIIGQALFPAS